MEEIKKGMELDGVVEINENVEGRKASPRLRDSGKHASFHSLIINGTGRTCLSPQRICTINPSV